MFNPSQHQVRHLWRSFIRAYRQIDHGVGDHFIFRGEKTTKSHRDTVDTWWDIEFSVRARYVH